MSEESSIINQKLRNLIIETMNEQSGFDTARDHLRYEQLRKMTPNEFGALWQRNIIEGIPFDQLMDELVLKSLTKV